MRTPLSVQELLVHFCNQMNLLQDYVKKYDAGQTHYAHEIAVKLRLLFHNTKFSKSLIGQLNLKQKYLLSNCSPYNPYNLAPHHPLVALQFNGGPNPDPKVPFGSMQPILNPFSSSLHLITIKKWWEEELVIVDSQKNEFTRSRIIREVADSDGGAHVDIGLSNEYFDLSRKNSIGWVYSVDKNISLLPLNNPVPPTIRAIADEVCVSLNPENDFVDVPIIE